MLNSTHQHIGRKTHNSLEIIVALVVYDLAAKASLQEVFNDFLPWEKIAGISVKPFRVYFVVL